MADAWDVLPQQDIVCHGFFLRPGELWCIPKDRLLRNGASPLAEILALSGDSSEGENVPAVGELPIAKVVVAGDRLVDINVVWPPSLQGKRFDLALGAETAERLGKTPETLDVQVISWGGWLIVMMQANYDIAWKEPW
jgi:hypothetical protein